MYSRATTSAIADRPAFGALGALAGLVDIAAGTNESEFGDRNQSEGSGRETYCGGSYVEWVGVEMSSSSAWCRQLSRTSTNLEHSEVWTVGRANLACEMITWSLIRSRFGGTLSHRRRVA